MNPRLDTPSYFLSDVARAADIDQNTLKAWLSREVVPLSPNDRAAEGAGSRRLLTLRTVYAVTLTAKLVGFGYSPSKAAAIAGTLVADEANDRFLVEDDAAENAVIIIISQEKSIQDNRALPVRAFIAASESEIPSIGRMGPGYAMTGFPCGHLRSQVDAALKL